MPFDKLSEAWPSELMAGILWIYTPLPPHSDKPNSVGERQRQ